MTLTLQEVVIVGACSEQVCDINLCSIFRDQILFSTLFQVKFSELTLDMFRMLQTLEREPQEDLAPIYDASPAPGRVPFV